MAYNRHSSSLSKVCKKVLLLAKGINSSLKWNDILLLTAHDLAESHTFDSSSKDCMLGNFPECLKLRLSLSDFKVDVDLTTFLQWQQVEK